MRRVTNLLTALVFCSLIIVVACKNKKPKDDPDPRDEQGELLTGTWAVTSAEKDDETREQWVTAGTTITFTYNNDTDAGTYQVQNLPEEGDNVGEVLGTGSQSFSFASEDDVNTIIKSNGDEITVTATETQLTLTFTVTGVDSRVSSFDGVWTFVLTKQ